MLKYKNIYIFLGILMNKVIAIKTGHQKKVGQLPDEKMQLVFFQIWFSNKKTSIFWHVCTLNICFCYLNQL